MKKKITQIICLIIFFHISSFGQENVVKHMSSDGQLKDFHKYEFWYQYDENGNMINYKDSEGFDFSCEYMDNKIVHEKHIDGLEVWFEYKNDKIKSVKVKNKGVKKFRKDVRWNTYITRMADLTIMTNIDEGLYEIFYKYDKRNNLIYCNDTKEGEWWNEYDSKNNLIKAKKKVSEHFDIKDFRYDLRGNLIEDEKNIYEYDDENRLISDKKKIGADWFSSSNENAGIFYAYDNKGRKKYIKYNATNTEVYYAYDRNGNVIHGIEFSNGKFVPWRELVCLYDENNNLLYREHFEGVDVYEYDGRNNLIHQKDSDDFEIWIEYEYDSNDRVVHKTEYRTEQLKVFTRKIEMPFVSIEKNFNKEDLGTSYYERMIRTVGVSVQ